MNPAFPTTSAPRSVLPPSSCLVMLLFSLSFTVALSAESQPANSAAPAQLAPAAQASWTNAPLALLRQAAEQGQPAAMFELYRRLEPSNRFPLENNESFPWLVKAAEAGHAEAQANYGFYHEHQIRVDPRTEFGPTNNMPEAVRWYRRAASQGQAGGQYHLGLCYLEGKGVEKDEEQGLELIRKAADQQRPYATCKLAELYAEGIGEPRNEQDRPVELLTRAAQRNVRDALDGLIFRYQHGLGIDRDLITAAGWYCSAAAARVRGYSLTDKMPGRTVAKNSPNDPFQQVLLLYLQAAQNDPKALLELGARYLTGRDVPRNSVRAWPWLTLASQHGGPDAAATASSLERQMTPEELQQARQLLVDLEDRLAGVAAAARNLPEPRSNPRSP